MSKKYHQGHGFKDKPRAKFTYKSYPEGREVTTDLEYSNDEFIHEPEPEDRPPPVQPTPQPNPYRPPPQCPPPPKNPNPPRNNNPGPGTTDRISRCLLNQVQKMRSDTELSKCKQALELERLKALEVEEMDEREQEIYHLYTQTSSIDHTCSRISQELDAILGKHEYLRQLREHSQEEEKALLQKHPQTLEMLRRGKKNIVTVANANVLPAEEEPLLDVLKRNLEKKLQKLRFLQSIAENINAVTDREDTPPASVIPHHIDTGIDSPQTGTSRCFNLPGPSKIQPVKSTRSSLVKPAPPLPRQEDSDSLESVSEDLESPSEGSIELEPVLSDYEEEPEKPFTNEEVYTELEEEDEEDEDEEAELFPSSREEDNWADSEGSNRSDRSEPRRQVRTMRRGPDSAASRQVTVIPKPKALSHASRQAVAALAKVPELPKRIRQIVPRPKTRDPEPSDTMTRFQNQETLPRPKAPDSYHSTSDENERDDEEQDVHAEDPSVHKLTAEYHPPKTDLVRVKPGIVQPLKAHAFAWMHHGPSKTKVQAANTSSSAASLSSSDTNMKAPPPPVVHASAPKVELGPRRGLQAPSPGTRVQPALIVTGKALPPMPPAPEPSRSLLSKPSRKFGGKVDKTTKSTVITEIPASNLLGNVNTALDPPSKSTGKLTETKPRPGTPTPNRQRPITPRSKPTRQITPKRVATPKRPTLNVAKVRVNTKGRLKPFNTLFTHATGLSDEDSEEEEGMIPMKYSRHVKIAPGPDQTDPSEQDPPTGHSVHVRSILRKSLTRQKESSAIRQPEKHVPNRFTPFNIFPEPPKPRLKSPPSKPVTKPVEPPTIARVTDSRTTIRKRRPSTPNQFKTEYSSNFLALSAKKSQYRTLNNFRKPPVPSHIVCSVPRKFDSPTVSLTKRLSVSGNYILRAPKRPSVSNLERVLKTKSRTNIEARARAKAWPNKFRTEEKPREFTGRKNLPDHLIFGNFAAITQARSARGIKSGALHNAQQTGESTKNLDPTKSQKLSNSKDRDKSAVNTSSKFSRASFNNKNK